ncbi:MAG TPA: hypothetical protein VNG13_13100 [Mycobacteriales bacterium]|nr:hypothetical protein [Mycobacteriales bacterium]
MSDPGNSEADAVRRRLSEAVEAVQGHPPDLTVIRRSYSPRRRIRQYSAASVGVLVVIGAIIGGLSVFGHNGQQSIVGFPGSTTSPTDTGTQVVDFSHLDVTLDLPVSWTATPYSASSDVGQNAYDGSSGWVAVDAVAGSGSSSTDLRQFCPAWSSNNVNHPYGTDPTVSYLVVDGQPACVIDPSPDGPFESRRTGGPSFQAAAVIVTYRQPIPLGRSTYALLLVATSPSTVSEITSSLSLSH